MQRERIVRFTVILLGTTVLATLTGFGFAALLAWVREGAVLREIAQENISRTAGTLNYGVVLETDPAERTMTLNVTLWYGSAREDHIYVVKVSDHAYVARQELTGNGGVFTRLTERAPITLDDIKPGERAAFVFNRREGELATDIIIIGNAL